MEELIKYLEFKTGKDVEPAVVQEMSPSQLAYIGDAIYETFVRTYLVITFKEPMHKLHKRSVELVRAASQSKSLQSLIRILSDDELYIVKRGRNTKSANIPSNADMMDYRRATAFESLLGYLYLSGRYERLFEIMWCALGIDKQNCKESDVDWDR